MAEHDDLDDILDSALDDFGAVDRGGSFNPRVSEETKTGQGLGLGLPALGPRGRRGGSIKAKSNGKTSSTSKTDEKTANGGHLSETLEELAQQTRQTLEGIEMKDQEAMTDKLVESIVKQFEELGSSEDMQAIMDTMMQQLLSKEVLHEPMKEFCEKYPNWLEVNKSSLSDEDFRRYSRQYEYIKELCCVYESTPNDFSRIVDIMQNMQTCGQPPDDLVQELGPGMDLKGDGLPFLSDFLKEGNQSAGANQNCSMM
ncbi:hypothetical protein GOP47_0006912 [Adiantum capillus-veneris]|uniref:Uncharacterized protein n=1 Tax=Adiantum capillus-veneris TaxID=13818 RepID=A0A9D4V0L0_ADICA|nr:hypothetical protein GOP47_0006912 [Adiantum capillus-veneris]